MISTWHRPLKPAGHLGAPFVSFRMNRAPSMTQTLLRRALLALAPVVLLTACGTTDSVSWNKPETLFGLLEPYRVDVVQGNVVTQEVMALVQPGLGRAQVREILGTPLLADPFHANRWDYVFTIRRQGVPIKSAPSPFSLKTTSWHASTRPSCPPRTTLWPPLPSRWTARIHPPISRLSKLPNCPCHPRFSAVSLPLRAQPAATPRWKAARAEPAPVPSSSVLIVYRESA